MNTFSHTVTLPFPADFLLLITRSNHNIPLRQRRSSNCALRPPGCPGRPLHCCRSSPLRTCPGALSSRHHTSIARRLAEILCSSWPPSIIICSIAGRSAKSRRAARWTRVAIGAYEFQLSLCTVVSSVPPASLAPPPPQLSYRVLSTGPCSRQIIPLPTSPFPLRLDHHYYTRYSHPPTHTSTPYLTTSTRTYTRFFALPGALPADYAFASPFSLPTVIAVQLIRACDKPHHPSGAHANSASRTRDSHLNLTQFLLRIGQELP